MVDHMVIRTGFMKNLISIIIVQVLRKKLNIDPDITLKELDLKYVDDKASGHISFEFELPKSDLISLVKEA